MRPRTRTDWTMLGYAVLMGCLSGYATYRGFR